MRFDELVHDVGEVAFSFEVLELVFGFDSLRVQDHQSSFVVQKMSNQAQTHPAVY